jgi:hypothetical protein
MRGSVTGTDHMGTCAEQLRQSADVNTNVGNQNQQYTSNVNRPMPPLRQSVAGYKTRNGATISLSALGVLRLIHQLEFGRRLFHG